MFERKKESDYFYIWKALCCCLVIVIHYPFPGTAGEMILAIARISVPFFLRRPDGIYSVTMMRKISWNS